MLSFVALIKLRYLLLGEGWIVGLHPTALIVVQIELVLLNAGGFIGFVDFLLHSEQRCLVLTVEG